MQRLQRSTPRSPVRALLVVVAAAALVGAPLRAEEPNYLKKGSAGTIKIEADRSDAVEILIRTVNDSEVLKTKRHTLGNRVWVDAGTHTLTVVCEFTTERGLNIKNGEVEVAAEDGGAYLLVLDGEQTDDRTCFLKAVPS